MRDAIVFKLLAINIALKLSEPDDGLLMPNWTNPKLHEPVKITKKNKMFYGYHKKGQNILDDYTPNSIKTVTIYILFANP